MRVLVGCEFSGRVREAFRSLGHEAVSIDLRSSTLPGPHMLGDVRDHLGDGWDLLIAFPPCTHLTTARNGHPVDVDARRDALALVRALYDAPVPFVAVENPQGVLSTLWRRPDQVVHPWQFGHPEHKRTCLWLRGLPLLVPTEVVVPTRKSPAERLSSHRQRWRSITYQGIADAMAEQWGPK